MSLHISKKNNSKSIFDKEIYVNFAKYILSCQDSEGGIHWEPNSKLDPWDHIESAMGLDVLGFEAESKNAYNWLRTYQESDGSWLSLFHSAEINNLRDCLKNKPHRFDRNWESKERYSMDWYYPILSGALSKSESIEKIKEKWDKFVVEGLGCKCVEEEPWVTAAESAELVLALTKIGLINEAEKILQDTFNLIGDDGLLWTGYVYKDKKFWPIEKPSWTMGAAILAGNSLNKFSPSGDFFKF